MDLVALRQRHHQLSAPATDVVSAAQRMCATQAQEFWGGRYALAVRTIGQVLRSDVDAAFNSRALVRSWPMRGTLHVSAAQDLRWILSVTATRVLNQLGPRHRELEITEPDLARTAAVLQERLPREGLRRADVFAALEADGIATAGQRGTRLISTTALRGLVCWGPVGPSPRGNTEEQRLVWVDDWITTHDEPHDPGVELFVRYVLGHGPATAEDYAWWSGLTLTAARSAASRAQSDPRVHRAQSRGRDLFMAAQLPSPTRAPCLHLLPSFDEYYLSYADRSVSCAADQAALIGPARNGMVRPTVLSQGRIVGTWQRRSSEVTLFAGESPDPAELAAALSHHRAWEAEPDRAHTLT